jgi:hypothetical protein
VIIRSAVIRRLTTPAASFFNTLSFKTQNKGKQMPVKIFDRIVATATSVRKPLPSSIERLLARTGALPVGSGKFRVADLDSAFSKAGMSVTERLRAKATLAEAGLLD